MKSILTDAEYKLVVRKIVALSNLSSYNTSDFEEVKLLSGLAIDYETRRYDFSLSYNQTAQNFQLNTPK